MQIKHENVIYKNEYYNNNVIKIRYFLKYEIFS